MPDTNPQPTFDQRYQQVGQQTNVAGDYIGGDQAYDVRGLANPYLGLQAFTYVERDRYAGREEDVDRGLALLTRPGDERSLLFVTGASGSGKSSFAQAGLLPALERQYRQKDFAVRWAVFRPGEKPLAGLAGSLRSLGVASEGVFAPASGYQLGPPPHPPDPTQISILIVDQFEELFTQSEPGQRDAVFAMLAELPGFRTARLHVIATMRADYLPDLFAHQALYDIAKAGIDLRVMTEEQLRAAIQRPLQASHPVAGKRFQDALLNKLAEDAAEDAAYLPLLQVSLEDLWRTGILTVDRYGNLTDAIRKRADEIYAYKRDAQGSTQPRPREEQASILGIFLALVDVSADDKASRDVRRTRRLEDVTGGSGDKGRLIQELTTARLLATDEKALGEGDEQVETVDIIHDSLLLNWPLLRDTIQAQREYLQQRGRFELRLSAWVENTRAKDRLLQSVDLAEAEHLRRLDDIAVRSQDAKDMIDSSIRERDRIRQRKQRITVAVATVLGVLLIAVLVAFQRAQKQSQIALSRQLAAQAELVADHKPLLALRLVLEGLARVPVTEETLRNELATTARGLSRKARVFHLASIDSELPDSKLWTDPTATYFVANEVSGIGGLRRIDSGDLIAPLSGKVNNITFGPGGTTFVAAYADDPGEIRRSVDGQVVASLPAPVNTVIPDPITGRLLAIEYTGGTNAELREFGTGRLVAPLSGKVIEKVHFDPLQRYLIVAYGDVSELLSWDGKVVAQIDSDVEAAVFDPNGRYYTYETKNVDGGIYRYLRRLDGSGEARRLPELSGSGSRVIYFDPGGRYVFEYGESDGVLIRLEDNPPVILFLSKDEFFYHHTLESDVLVLEYNDTAAEFLGARAEVFRLEDGQSVAREENGIIKEVYANAQSPSLVVDYSNQPAELRRADDWTLVARLADEEIDGVSFDGTGEYFIIDYNDGLGELRRTKDGGLITKLSGEVDEDSLKSRDSLGDSQWQFESFGGDFLVGYSDPPHVELRHLQGGEVVKQFPTEDTLSWLRFLPLGNLFAIRYDDGSSELRLTRNGELVKPLKKGSSINLSGNSAHFFILTEPGSRAELRQLDDGKPVAEELMGTAVELFESDPTGSYFVVGYYDAPGELIETESNQIKGRFGLAGTVKPAEKVVFSPTGNSFVARYYDASPQIIIRSGQGSYIQSKLGFGLEDIHYGDAEGRLLVRYANGDIDLLDLEWLKSLGSDLESLSAEDLERLACEGPLASSLWRQYEEEFAGYLGDGRDALTCH